MKKVIVIGAISSYAVEKFFTASKELCLDPIFIFNKTHLPENSLNKNQIVMIDNLNTRNSGELLYFLNGIKDEIYSIVPGGELAVPITEKICNELDFPHNNGDIARFRNKFIMREYFSNSGSFQPKVFGKVSTLDEINELIHQLKFPLIVKPVDCAASFFVKKVFDKYELIDGFKRILNHKKSETTGVDFSKQMILEEYISGSEYSAEVIVMDHKRIQYFITRKILSEEPDFDEIGHISLNRKDEPSGIKNFIDSLIISMDVWNAVLHIEFKVNTNGDIYLIEFATRIAGDMISNITEYAHNVSLEKLYILIRSKAHNIIKGQSIDESESYYGIKFIFNHNNKGNDDIQIIESNIAQKYKLLENISKFNILKRIGFEIFKVDNLSTAIEYIEAN